MAVLKKIQSAGVSVIMTISPVMPLNVGVIHWSESPPNAHDILSRWCDRFEPETGSRTVHPYLDGGDVGLTP
ncbi:hypothetical protein CRG98_037043 [Punica granatum]|uniref:Uncharacterized protein n=1 Tax=Punica granatum TaxID=22663 RepID=A0A2I0IFI7_PUNGR|nr:hypothetical protein CRG98_037043 [Punica granatum]